MAGTASPSDGEHKGQLTIRQYGTTPQAFTRYRRDLAQDRERALKDAGYRQASFAMECLGHLPDETYRGKHLSGVPVYFTKSDRSMVYRDGREGRPWVAMFGRVFLTDKRGRVRRFASSAAALKASQKRERDTAEGN